jgi:hypothetical protein
MTALYKDPFFIKVVEDISGRKPLMLSAPSDPHAMVIYFYTTPGDFIGWHYDTSFYYGERLTVLVPLFDNSTCELQLELLARDLEAWQASMVQDKEVTHHTRHTRHHCHWSLTAQRWQDVEPTALQKFFVWIGKLRSQQQQARQDGAKLAQADYSTAAHECVAVHTTPGEIIFFNGDQVPDLCRSKLHPM